MFIHIRNWYLEELVCFFLALVSLLGVCFFWVFKSTFGVVMLACLCFAFCAMASIKRSGSGFFSASVICLVALFCYSMAVPFHHLIFQDYSDAGVRFVVVMCALAAAAQFVGYRYAGGGEANLKRVVMRQRDRLTVYFGFFMIVFGLLSAFLAVFMTTGFSAYLDAGYAGRALLKREVGPVELGLYYSIVGYLFVVYDWFFGRPRRRFLLGLFLIFFLVLFVAYVSFLGIRRPSFFLVMSLLFIYFLKIRGRVPLFSLMFVFLIVFLFGIFASFRQVLSDHGVAEAVFFVFSEFSFSWLDLSSSELGAPFRAMLDVREYWFPEGFRWGGTYLGALIGIIPSGIYKYSDSLSVEYTNYFFSENYIAIGGNMGFFPVAEGYLNFGALGVALEFFAVGWFVKKVENLAVCRGGAVPVVMYAIMVPWYFFFLRTDVSAFAKSFFYSVVVVFLVYYIYSLCLRVLSKVSTLQLYSCRGGRHKI